MSIFIKILIFCIILIVYLHIRFHLKVNNDLEVFNVNEHRKERITEICNLKQPFTFNYHNPKMLEFLNFNSLLKQQGKQNINVKKINDEDVLSIKLENALDLFEKDASNNYISCNNHNFLNNTNLVKYFENDDSLKPVLISNKKYDILMAKSGLYTQMKYSLYNRNFLYVTQGSCKVKLFSPNNISNMDLKSNYQSLEYVVNMNPFKDNTDGFSQTEVELKQGSILFIPPYWLYCVYFQDNSVISLFQYGTYVSNVSILPVIIKNFFQKQNVNIKID